MSCCHSRLGWYLSSAFLLYLIVLAILLVCRLDDTAHIYFSQSAQANKLRVGGDVMTDMRINRPRVRSIMTDNSLERQYPSYESLLTILERWPPDEPDRHPSVFNETLQCFNYSDPREKAAAEEYRNAELPFKLYDVRELTMVQQRWTDEYLIKNMATMTPHVEESSNNHFMYWNIDKLSKSQNAPTNVIDMKFEDWLGKTLHITIIQWMCIIQ